MNIKKIVFAIIWVGILLSIALLFNSLSGNTDSQNTVSRSWDIQIWILEDESSEFLDYISDFKEEFPQYKNTSFSVESFSDSISYTSALTSAFLQGVGPDIFTLNNSESSPLENQTMVIDPTKVSPNDFRLRFKAVFWNDLIISDPNDASVEYIKWIPSWYETLAIFYNRKYFLRPSEMRTWTDIAKEIRNISKKYTNIIPLALGNGSSITRSGDIVRSLFVAEGANWLTKTDNNTVRQVLGSYSEFWNVNGDNGYNDLSTSLYDSSDIDFFIEGNVAAMFWFPRDLLQIDAIWYQKSFLFATPFPRVVGSEKSISINYNYFVVNKDTLRRDLAMDFLSFMASEEGQEKYIETFPYYLSPELAVEAELSEKKILPGYNIVYKNFVDEDALLVSYNSGDKNIFDREIAHILDKESWFEQHFNDMASFLICSTGKHVNLLNLSSSCK